MNISEFYQTLIEQEESNTKIYEDLAEKILAVKNPMNFDEEFMSDEQIEALEEALDYFEMNISKSWEFKENVISILPSKAEPSFI